MSFKNHGQRTAQGTISMSARTRWSNHLRSLKLALDPRHSSKNNVAVVHNLGSDQAVAVDLPVVVWMEHIFPFLDRSGQDRLAEAHQQVAIERRSEFHQQKMDWPCGVVHKLSRPVKKVTFSPDNSTLLITCCKRKVLLYDKLRGPKSTITGHSGIVADVKFSPLGRSNNEESILATASRNDGSILLWKQSNNNSSSTQNDTEYECFRSLLIYQHDLRHMVWSPLGDRIASWGQDGFVRVSDCQDGSLKSRHWKTRLEVSGCLETVAFEPPSGGTVAFAPNNDRVTLWNTKKDTVRDLPNVVDEFGSYRGAFVTSLAYSPDGSFFVVGFHVAKVRFFSVVPTSCGHSPGSNEEEATEERSDNHVAQDSQYVFHKQIHLGGGWSAVTLLSFTSDGHFLACSNHGSQIRIVDTLTDQILTTLNGHTGRIESLAFTSDGRALASGSCDRTIRLWNTSQFCSVSRGQETSSESEDA